MPAPAGLCDRVPVKPLSCIQILRAVAALGVLLFHACQWSGLDFAVGAAGVDLFFLISGFVLWLSAERGAPSPGGFLAARAVRVAPLYWLWTGLSALVAWRWPGMLPVVSLNLRHGLLSLAFLPHLDPGGGPFPLLPSGWTLTYEAYFYLAFAVALTLPKHRRFQALAVMLTITALVGFAYHRWYILLANPLLLEFLAGAALARCWRSGALARLGGRRAAPASLALGVLLLALQQIAGIQSDFWRPVLFGAPAAMILTGALKLDQPDPFTSKRMPVRRLLTAGLARLGDASYSLYLCQLPVVMAVLALTPVLSGSLRVAITIPLAVMVGLTSYFWIERPLTESLRRALTPAAPLRMA